MVTIKQNMVSGLRTDILKLEDMPHREYTLDEQLCTIIEPTDDRLLFLVTSYERMLVLAHDYWDEFVRTAPALHMELADYINAEGLRVQFLELQSKVTTAGHFFEGSKGNLMIMLDFFIFHTWMFLDYRRGKMVTGYNPLTKKWMHHNAKVYYADRSHYTIVTDQPFEKMKEDKKEQLMERVMDELEHVMRWHANYYAVTSYVSPAMHSLIPSRTMPLAEPLELGLSALIENEEDLYVYLEKRTHQLPARGVKIELGNAGTLKEVHMFDGTTPWGDDYAYFILKYVSSDTNRLRYDVTALNMSYPFWSHNENRVGRDITLLLACVYLTYTCVGFYDQVGIPELPMLADKNGITGGFSEKQVSIYGTGTAKMIPIYTKEQSASTYTEYWRLTWMDEFLLEDDFSVHTGTPKGRAGEQDQGGESSGETA